MERLDAAGFARVQGKAMAELRKIERVRARERD
jgi:hypothetical protein